MPDLRRVWEPSLDNGLSVNYDGVVNYVAPGSPAAAAAIQLGDRVLPPLPRGLYRDPPDQLSIRLVHGGAVRSVTLAPRPYLLTLPSRLRLLALYLSYLVFLVVGSGVLLLRPNAMTWAFFLYCTFRRWGDLGFYWPGSSEFFWFNVLLFGTLGAATCVLVTIFALRFPNDRLDGWRRPLSRVANLLLILLPAAWCYVYLRLFFWGLPSQSLADLLVRLTSVVYLGAATIFVVTFFRSHGEGRQRLRWILIFPLVLVMRVIAINQGNRLLPYTLPGWFADALVVLAICVPLAVAYAVIRRRVFDVEFAISRALVYGSITSMIAAAFLVLDWFLSRQFAQTRVALLAEIVLALGLGSWLNQLHRSVDRLIDAAFFRRRHLAEQRLARASAAVLLAETHEAVDRFLVHEPVEALDLTSAALFHRDESMGRFIRTTAVGWNALDTLELGSDDPLVLHLLAERSPVRLAEVRWSSDTTPPEGGNPVLASPVLLRKQLAAIALYGAHRTGTDIDPDEVKSLAPLAAAAGTAYAHIEARAVRAQVELLIDKCAARDREIEIRDRDIETRDREIEALRAKANAPRIRPDATEDDA